MAAMPSTQRPLPLAACLYRLGCLSTGCSGVVSSCSRGHFVGRGGRLGHRTSWSKPDAFPVSVLAENETGNASF